MMPPLPHLIRCVWITFLLHLHTRVASRRRSGKSDHGSCNITSNGSEYLGGYYGATMLRPIPPTPAGRGEILYCTYTFQGASGQRVMFSVKKLIVGQYNDELEECEYGFLRLWDGMRQPGRYPYRPNTLCGQYTIGEISVRKFSTQSTAEVEFYTDRLERHTTFTLTYKYVNIDLEGPSFPKKIRHDMLLESSSVCHWQIIVDQCGGSCDLLSPGYPGIYPPDVECHYHIYTNDENAALQFIFSGHSDAKPREFDLRETPSCARDYLDIYEGSSTHEPLIGRFCGRGMPDITSVGGHLYMVFVSGLDRPPYGHIGFYGTAVSLTKEWHQDGRKADGTWCDWEFNATEGSVSPPDHWLPPDTTCVYTFHLQPSMYLEFILTIYGLGSVCADRIEVWESTRLVDKICQGKLEKPQPRFLYNLTASPVRLKYYTTHGQYQSHPDIGFWLSYRQIQGPKKPVEPVKLKDDAAVRRVNTAHLPSVSNSSPLSNIGSVSMTTLGLITCLGHFVIDNYLSSIYLHL